MAIRRQRPASCLTRRKVVCIMVTAATCLFYYLAGSWAIGQQPTTSEPSSIAFHPSLHRQQQQQQQQQPVNQRGGRGHRVHPQLRPSSWRNIHQQALPSGKIPPRLASWTFSWRSCMHGWRYREWSEADNERLVRSTTPWFHTAYTRLPSKRDKVVVARYIYMYVYGGVYADLDSRCLRSFEQLVADCGVALSGSGREDTSQQPRQQQRVTISFLFSKPGHPLWLRLLKLIHEIVWQRKELPEGVTKGASDPALLAHVVEKTLHSFKDGGPQLRVCVMPPEYFNAPPAAAKPAAVAAAGLMPLVASPAQGVTTLTAAGCKPWNLMTEQDLTRCESANIRSYVLHLPVAVENADAISVL